VLVAVFVGNGVALGGTVGVLVAVGINVEVNVGRGVVVLVAVADGLTIGVNVAVKVADGGNCVAVADGLTCVGVALGTLVGCVVFVAVGRNVAVFVGVKDRLSVAVGCFVVLAIGVALAGCGVTDAASACTTTTVLVGFSAVVAVGRVVVGSDVGTTCVAVISVVGILEAATVIRLEIVVGMTADVGSVVCSPLACAAIVCVDACATSAVA
jgi:hypothetical protein